MRYFLARASRSGAAAVEPAVESVGTDVDDASAGNPAIASTTAATAAHRTSSFFTRKPVSVRVLEKISEKVGAPKGAKQT